MSRPLRVEYPGACCHVINRRNAGKKRFNGASDEENTLSKGRKRNITRDLSIYLARDNSGISYEERVKYFGGISGAGITMRYNNVYRKVAGNRKSRYKGKMIRNRIMNN